MKFSNFARGGFGHIRVMVLGITAAALATNAALAQQDDEELLEEVVVVGSQIKGAKITDALAVSVFDAEDIAALGIESGAELLDLIPENGQNFFSEADTGGGVNGARGDVGAFNLRNMGTGNTLVLMNGRRLVNSATFQTEEVGGSFVPVNSVNSNHIPVFGVERVEVLRDGASAIYGADAVAGVVNTVLKDDFEGFTLRLRQSKYDATPRDDRALSLEWGKSFNGGDTHVGVFARHYSRDRTRASDDPRWADSDFRSRFDDDSPFATATTFRNNSANSLFGQFDVVPGLGSSHSLRQNDVVDNAGEFEVYPIGDPRCDGGFDTGYGTCIHEDGQGTIRYNFNADRDVLSELDRNVVYGYFNHIMDNNNEFFADAYFYQSSTSRRFGASTPLSAVPLRVGAENYYNPLGPCGSPNRLPDSIIGADVPCSGLELRLDNYRFAERTRVVNNDGQAYRVLAGLRGTTGNNWDWETAITYSKAEREDLTQNRVANSLITAALFDPTPSAYNPFSGGVNSNIEQALVDVSREGEATLGSWDVKFSKGDVWQMPAGPVGALFGMELRREDYVDDRDPRLDGTIAFVDFEGETFPLTSDVVNSSPTPDGRGDRATSSLFGELQIPLHRTLDVQLAARYEDFSDIGDTTVGKIAAGWRPWEPLLIRGSYSTAFRAPNLVTINEQFVARNNTRDDWVCFYGVDQGSLDEDTFSDCDYGVQRQATGSRDLRSEESDNISLGFALTPIQGLTLTLDFWSIEKRDTIGLFGEENHILLDLVERLGAGTANCAAGVTGNPQVIRDDPTTDPLEVAGFLSAGLCPVGQVLFVQDSYANLDTRTVEGYDIGLYFDYDTSSFGDFSFRYNGSFYTDYTQDGTGGLSAQVLAAQAADPTIVYPLVGLGDLINFEGNQDEKHTATLSWNRGDWSASLTGNRLGSFFDVLSTGDRFTIPSMTTYNVRVDYKFDVGNVDTRVRLGINNFTDERAPIADASFGFFQDAHRDWGRSVYLDLRLGL